MRRADSAEVGAGLRVEVRDAQRLPGGAGQRTRLGVKPARQTETGVHGPCQDPRQRHDVWLSAHVQPGDGPSDDHALDWHVSDPAYIEVLCQAAGSLAFPELTGEEPAV